MLNVAALKLSRKTQWDKTMDKEKEYNT